VRTALTWFAALITLAAALVLIGLGGVGAALLFLSALGGKGLFVVLLLLSAAAAAAALGGAVTLTRRVLRPSVTARPAEMPDD
jgi:hypothetical protein